jgi:ribosomal protein L27
MSATDDTPLFVLKRDASGGMNTRLRPEVIGDNQSVLLKNVMLETQGQTSIRLGMRQVDDRFPYASDVIFNQDGVQVTNEDGTVITTDNVYITNQDGAIVTNLEGTNITEEE